MDIKLYYLLKTFIFFQIKEIINEEEAQFLKTLSRGRRLFNREADKATDKKISGMQFNFIIVCKRMINLTETINHKAQMWCATAKLNFSEI